MKELKTHVTIPRQPRKGLDVLTWASDVNYAIRQLANRKMYGSSGGGGGGAASKKGTKPPFTVTLQGDYTNGYTVNMIQGYVISRENNSDAVQLLTVTSTPGIPTPLTVVSGDKIYCEISVNEYGIPDGASIASGSTYPTSIPPVLIGGDDIGAAGYFYIPICEIEDAPLPDPLPDPPPPITLRTKQVLTGHIDYFQPGFINNLVSSYTTGEGGLSLARYAGGEWQLRGLSKASGGLTITETTDEIEITGNGVSGENGAVTVDDGLVTEVKEFTAGSFAHPWKVTDGGGGNAAIAAGFILGHYFNYYTAALGTSTGDGTFGPDEITLGPGASYAGGTQAISGTQYIYAEIPSNASSLEYTETQGSDLSSIVLIETTDKTEPLATDTATIAVSTLAPGTYAPTAGKAATCIAKVTNVAGVLSITQYVTHNPTMFIPINNISVGDTT